jgi:hypothetical protein
VEGLAFEALQARTEAQLVLANDWQPLKPPH